MAMDTPLRCAELDRFIAAIGPDSTLDAIAAAIRDLVAGDGWLPGELRIPAADGYRREALFEAGDGRLSVGCFVWGPGQATPIHDHRSWGVIGVLSGRLRSESFTADGRGGLVAGPTAILDPGQSAWVDPGIGDIHRIGAADGLAISIHAYGTGFADVCKTRYDGVG